MIIVEKKIGVEKEEELSRVYPKKKKMLVSYTLFGLEKKELNSMSLIIRRSSTAVASFNFFI